MEDAKEEEEKKLDVPVVTQQQAGRVTRSKAKKGQASVASMPPMPPMPPMQPPSGPMTSPDKDPPFTKEAVADWQSRIEYSKNGKFAASNKDATALI